MEHSFELKIPKERIAVVIGKNGETKKYLEAQTNTRLAVDSDEGDVTIKGDDPLQMFSTREIIRAIGRGFSPETALLMLKSDYVFELVSMQEFTKAKHTMTRLKGRVIGADGKSRRTIEELTECRISVYGKTIWIIGNVEKVQIARRAIESLLKGSPHSKVFRWLEKQRSSMPHKKFMDNLGV